MGACGGQDAASAKAPANLRKGRAYVMELITSAVDLQFPVNIVNFEQLKAELTERLKHYQGLVVTEDAIKDAKKDRAALNKLVAAIEDKRKSVKKEVMAPYDSFEKKVKELVALIQDPINLIDGQVKEFEEIQKREKHSAISAHYNDGVGDLSELIALERVIPEKWANAGMALKDVCEDVDAKLLKIRNDLKIIRATNTQYEQAMIDVYLRAFDMSAALAENARLEEQQKALKRQKEQDAAQRKEQGAAQKNTAEDREGPSVDTAGQEETAAFDPDIRTIRVVFYDTTPDFREAMKQLTIKHGIRYGSA